MAKNIVPTLWYLRGEFLALAVLRVYRQNEHAAPVSGCEAEDETWGTNSAQRRDLLDRTRQEWCRIAGKDFTWFPYAEDAVVRLYMRYRQKTSGNLQLWEIELNEADKS